MRPPYYVPQGSRYVPPAEGRVYRPASRLLRVLAIVAVIAALVALAWVFASALPGAERPSPGLTTMPAPYGPPGPNGGPQ